MQKLKKFLVVALALASVILMPVTRVWAGVREQVLYNFSGGMDGGEPSSTAGLIFDAEGNLYGTTLEGGPQNGGTVFKLTHDANGGWTETVLHTFTGSDGFNPYSSLVFDAQGNLYGTTIAGGSNGCTLGCGVVFKLTPGANGDWTETVLHSFSGEDGSGPIGGLVFDRAGNLYGTTFQGGSHQFGVVFRLTRLTPVWTYEVLHSFDGSDGALSYAGLILDKAGNLYGTTCQGGSYNDGTVFQLALSAKGKWKESVLHAFNAGTGDGYCPQAGLILDAKGSLYGSGGGGKNCNGYWCGTVFKLAPRGNGKWKKTVLHAFDGKDGFGPNGVIFGSQGKLYGTTVGGGDLSCNHPYGCGVAFRLTCNADGLWKETVLHVFKGNPDGTLPAPPILDPADNLYGAAVYGGTNAWGVVFEITP